MPGFDTVTKGFWKDMERGVALFIKQGNMAGTEQVTHPKRLALSRILCREGHLCRFEPTRAVATPF